MVIFNSYVKLPEGTRINQPFGNSITNIGDLMGFYGDSIEIFIGSNGIYWVIESNGGTIMP